MSTFEIWSVSCPACARAQETNVFVSVNASRVERAEREIIDGSFGRQHCPGCGHQFHLDYRMLFTNMRKAQWVVQYPRTAREDAVALEQQADELFRREWLGNAPAPIAQEARRARRRICFGRRQLGEKLLAWREGLDDHALECLKLVMMRELMGELLAHGPTELRLAEVDGQALHFDVVSLDEGRSLATAHASHERLAAVADDIEAFRAPFPELLDGLYVDASRYLVAH